MTKPATPATKPGGTTATTPGVETKPDGTKVETTTETKTDGTKVETTTETKTDGSKTETTTETKADGSKTETITETKADGSKTETTTETKTDGSKTETTTETRTDGTRVETTAETKADGSKTETKTEVKTDGSRTEKVVETKTDGSVKTTETVTETDGSAEKTEFETVKNSAGSEVAVTTSTKTDASGNITDIVQQAVIENVGGDTSATVTVKKDGSGRTTTADADVTQTADGNKVSLSGGVIAQLKEAAGVADVAVTLTVKDNSGNTKFKLQADASDLKPGSQLYIYQYDSATGEYTMVNAKKYNVDANGGVDVAMSKNATYQLMSAEDAAKVSKEILKTVTVKKSSANVKPGKSTKIALSNKVNQENIKSIKYSVNKKSVVKVSKNGKITAQKSGKVTVKATVTLKNGKKKTVKMKINIK